MTIFFSNHNYKYEVEGVAKLFLPLQSFKHVYDHVAIIPNSIITRLKKGRHRTYLWVMASIDNQVVRLSCNISNTVPAYSSECERMLCILLYKVLHRITSIVPAWGILTGVRPVATIQRLRKLLRSDDEIRQYMQKNYLVTPDKIDLSLLTARVQAPFIERLGKNSYSLYISIPFCTSRCSYCSFVSQAINTKKSLERVDEYVGLLCEELAYTAKLAAQAKLSLDTIYIGGGTPTALTALQLSMITDAISANFDVSSATEYTIEAGRADTITREKLEVIKAAGATRISINPQTFNDDVLVAIGRNHTAQDVIDCYALAKSMGFTDINMDLIAGLPTDTVDSFARSIQTAISLEPSSITVHTLSIKRSSHLFELERPDSTLARGSDTALMTKLAGDRLIQSNYAPYYLYRQKNTVGNLENVGYAKKGFESLYNIYIMDEIQTILACGAGGVTKLVDGNNRHIRRIFNYKYHFEYIDGFDEILRRKEGILNKQQD